MNVYNLNTDMVYSERGPNIYLIGTAKEMKWRLKQIDVIHSMLFNSNANEHIKWVLFCELACLVNGQ